MLPFSGVVGGSGDASRFFQERRGNQEGWRMHITRWSGVACPSREYRQVGG